jgi:hypothetical protein
MRGVLIFLYKSVWQSSLVKFLQFLRFLFRIPGDIRNQKLAPTLNDDGEPRLPLVNFVSNF